MDVRATAAIIIGRITLVFASLKPVNMDDNHHIIAGLEKVDKKPLESVADIL